MHSCVAQIYDRRGRALIEGAFSSHRWLRGGAALVDVFVDAAPMRLCLGDGGYSLGGRVAGDKAGSGPAVGISRGSHETDTWVEPARRASGDQCVHARRTFRGRLEQQRSTSSRPSVMRMGLRLGSPAPPALSRPV